MISQMHFFSSICVSYVRVNLIRIKGCTTYYLCLKVIVFSETSVSAYWFRVVFPLCGGNIDSTVLGRVIERGLAADGRLLRFSVVVSDRPGGIAELTQLLANLGVR